MSRRALQTLHIPYFALACCLHSFTTQANIVLNTIAYRCFHASDLRLVLYFFVCFDEILFFSYSNRPSRLPPVRGISTHSSFLATLFVPIPDSNFRTADPSMVSN